MLIQKQPDGTYATTPILIGCMKDSQCVHHWVDHGPTAPLNEKVSLQLQRCSLCKPMVATRSRLVGSPDDILEFMQHANSSDCSTEP